MTGRHRKTKAQLQKAGSYRKGKHGDRAPPRSTSGAPVVPASVTDDIGWLWDLAVSSLPDHVSKADAALIEGLCRWWKKWDTAMNRSRIPAAIKAWTHVERIAGKFGMSPQDRLKMAGPATATVEEDPFEKLRLVTG